MMKSILSIVSVLVLATIAEGCGHSLDAIENVITKLNDETCNVPSFKEIEEARNSFEHLKEHHESGDEGFTADQLRLKTLIVDDQWESFKERVNSPNLIRSVKVKVFMRRVDDYHQDKFGKTICDGKYAIHELANIIFNQAKPTTETDKPKSDIVHPDETHVGDQKIAAPSKDDKADNHEEESKIVQEPVDEEKPKSVTDVEPVLESVKPTETEPIKETQPVEDDSENKPEPVSESQLESQSEPVQEPKSETVEEEKAQENPHTDCKWFGRGGKPGRCPDHRYCMKCMHCHGCEKYYYAV